MSDSVRGRTEQDEVMQSEARREFERWLSSRLCSLSSGTVSVRALDEGGQHGACGGNEVARWNMALRAGVSSDVECVPLSGSQPAQGLQQEMWRLYQSWCRRLRMLAPRGREGALQTDE